jgi:mRNA interferase RelE/StbE
MTREELEHAIRAACDVAKETGDPRPQGSKKLSGEDLYRIRQGDYRILYGIQDRALSIVVIRIGHRRDVYR